MSVAWVLRPCPFWMLCFECDEGEIELGGKNWRDRLGGRAGEQTRQDLGQRDLKLTMELAMV